MQSEEYTDKYTMKTDRIDSVREQANMRLAWRNSWQLTVSALSQTPSRICTA